MASTDFHLRRLIYEAQRAGERTQRLGADGPSLWRGWVSCWTATLWEKNNTKDLPMTIPV